jgi:hypothetical protein
VQRRNLISKSIAVEGAVTFAKTCAQGLEDVVSQARGQSAEALPPKVVKSLAIRRAKDAPLFPVPTPFCGAE